ncbi:xanthine dehydrogenase family protein molybdopterin-binding subunit [Reichenbachiella ulvae]|uniref:Molybdopterin-dependent oxidoreductase n=1 Tax=Reichenbachiella ulvae TaxID=2980104 RepID=A0ABT3CQW3_9BACT|nr:molybdopterin cofactor-binding domain-containing protein [Reichenbachiella ulvae]MCV9386012.1 molybdopterin-dependent oxidoreductase [Reichenbachiella ulvae]
MTLIKTKYNRRSFLKVSGAAGGGLLLGFSWLNGCMPAGESGIASIPNEWFEINGFIKIGDTGLVTIFSPNPEIGQNVKTSMPLIVAEELDVDWKNVVVEQAPLNTDIFQRQIAGGSQSIRHGWKALRMAGATGKRMLMEAAAQKLSVPVSELTVSQGVISHQASGKSLSYGEVASLAATMEVPEEVELKDNKDFKLIGTKVKNVDGQKIVTGQPLFGLDYQREGMLIAMIIHAPAFGMKIKSFDATEAKAMPGIKDVITVNTWPDEPQWSDLSAFRELIAVVGDTTWQVLKAKKAVKVEWEVDTALESTADHIERLKKAVESDQGNVARVDGDPDKAFAEADEIIESSFTAPFLAHNTMEPMNFFAHVTDTKAELVGPIQTPEYLEHSLASLLGMSHEQIDIKMTRMGGGFGRRLYGNFANEAAVISQLMKAPIKLIYTREDDMTQGAYRPAYRVKYRAALDADKNMTAFEVKAAGVDDPPLFANRYPAGTLAHYKATEVKVDSNITTAAWRAPRSNFIAGAEQAFLDEVAEKVGKDPIDFRLELFDKAMANPVGEKNDYDAERYAGVIKLVKERSNWGVETPGIKRGMAAYYCHNSYVAQVVDLAELDGEWRVKKVWCAVDCGIVVNREGAVNMMEGGIVDGLGHAMFSQMTFKDGKPDQSNFHNYQLIRQEQAPLEIETFFVENNIDPTGLGEPPLPPVIGALANALYQATGKRYYDQPFLVS